jgi:hypothetical protein
MMMAASGAPYVIPFQNNLHPQKKDDYLDTLDKLDVLEYDTEMGVNNNDHRGDYNKDTIEKEDFNIDMKDYDNFILKIEDLIVTDDKMLSKLKDNLLYLECKVPLFKADKNKTNKEANNNENGVFDDTFK